MINTNRICFVSCANPLRPVDNANKTNENLPLVTVQTCLGYVRQCIRHDEQTLTESAVHMLQKQSSERHEYASTSAPYTRSHVVENTLPDLTVHALLTARGLLAIMGSFILQHPKQCTVALPINQGNQTHCPYATCTNFSTFTNTYYMSYDLYMLFKLQTKVHSRREFVHNFHVPITYESFRASKDLFVSKVSS